VPTVTARCPSIDWTAALGVSLALGLLLFAASFSVGRHGFSPDEEITALVVRGIAETGAPVLPSGMLYLRGLPYSYAAWLGGALFGHELVVYRGVSLVFALLAVVLIFLVTRAVSTPTAGVVAALLFAASPFLVSAAVFARFYAAFVAAALFAAWLLVRPRMDRAPNWPFLLVLTVCRSLHEFAFVIALLPVCLALSVDRDKAIRRRCLVLSAQSIVLLLTMQAGQMALERWSLGELGEIDVTTAPGLGVFSHAPAALPPLFQFALAGPLTLWAFAIGVGLLVWMLRRMTGVSWSVLLACAACVFFFQIGALLAVVVAALLMTPRDAARIVGSGLVIGMVGTAAWVVHTFSATSMAVSWANTIDIAFSTTSFPWEAVWHLAEERTLAVTLFVATTLWAAAVAQRAQDTVSLRALLLFGFSSVLALGVSALEFQWRYTLLVLPFLLVGAAPSVEAVRAGLRIAWPHGRWLGWTTPAVVAAVLVLAADEDLDGLRRGDRSLMLPTSPQFDRGAFSAATAPGDALICNDEMACRFLTGRADYWLLPRPDIASQYVGAGPNGGRSLYGAAAVLANAEDLHAAIWREQRAVAIVVLDTGKFDYEQSREMAVALAKRHGGTVTSVGGSHLVVRVLQADRSCEGEEP
jgi:hypothetical protein